MKMFEVVLLKPEKVVVKTDAQCNLELNAVVAKFVDQMEPVYGIAPILHSVKRIYDEPEKEPNEPEVA